MPLLPISIEAEPLRSARPDPVEGVNLPLLDLIGINDRRMALLSFGEQGKPSAKTYIYDETRSAPL